ncbi:MAG: NYN domain-containing protein [Synechococcus sp. SB0678_bin_12]|nr:NYN domain-containing protein [Synechococcus sp. SB0678_bin_12]MYI87322.1 NYN domain-containing protein [Synechococcus sp. SB0672_bin_10]
MDRIFLYWDNSNIFISAQDLAAEREGWGARSRVRTHFPTMIRLARRERLIGRALAVGSVPPELRGVWNRLRAEGIEVPLFERGQLGGGENRV